jgi:transposase
MAPTAAAEPPPATPDSAINPPQSARLRFLLWMSFGYLLGLPVTELFNGINLQTEILKRNVGKRRWSYTMAERLRLLDIQKKLGKHLRKCVDWLASPQTLAKAIKRYQEHMAQDKEATDKKGPGRPRLAQTKVDAILTIYRGGCRGLSRIVGEMNKCGLSTNERTVRRVLNQKGLSPGNGRGPMGSSWTQFLRLHAKQLPQLAMFQNAMAMAQKLATRIRLFFIPSDTQSVTLRNTLSTLKYKHPLAILTDTEHMPLPQ